MGNGETGCTIVLLAVVGAGYWAWTVFDESRRSGEGIWGKCAFGSELAGAHPPSGTEEWCQKQGPTESYRRHGPYRKWYPEGEIQIQGAYRQNMRAGKWAYWKRDGILAAEVEFHYGRVQTSERVTQRLAKGRGAAVVNGEPRIPSSDASGFVLANTSTLQIVNLLDSRGACEKLGTVASICLEQPSVWCARGIPMSNDLTCFANEQACSDFESPRGLATCAEVFLGG